MRSAKRFARQNYSGVSDMNLDYGIVYAPGCFSEASGHDKIGSRQSIMLSIPERFFYAGKYSQNKRRDSCEKVKRSNTEMACIPSLSSPTLWICYSVWWQTGSRMPKLPVRSSPSVEGKPLFQIRFLPIGRRAVHVGWTLQYEDW